jgi:hypothetical protein
MTEMNYSEIFRPLSRKGLILLSANVNLLRLQKSFFVRMDAFMEDSQKQQAAIKEGMENLNKRLQTVATAVSSLSDQLLTMSLLNAPILHGDRGMYV